jgi:hypothetical protein
MLVCLHEYCRSAQSNLNPCEGGLSSGSTRAWFVSCIPIAFMSQVEQFLQDMHGRLMAFLFLLQKDNMSSYQLKSIKILQDVFNQVFPFKSSSKLIPCICEYCKCVPKFIALGSLRFSHVCFQGYNGAYYLWNHAKQLWHS